MAPGSRRSGWGICGNLHYHVSGAAGDTAGVQLRRRGHQQHDYGITNRERRTLLALLPGGGRVFASSATDLDDGWHGFCEVAATAAVAFSTDDGCDVGVDTGSPVLTGLWSTRKRVFRSHQGVQLAIAEDAESVDHLVSPEEASSYRYGTAVGIPRTVSRNRLPVTGMERVLHFSRH